MISDQDLETLDQYLDDALEASDAESLRRRLQAEPELAAEMRELVAQRDARREAWESLEPDEAGVQRCMAAVARAIRRERNWMRVGRLGRIGSAIAACIVLSFFAGWVGRGKSVPATGSNAALHVAHSGVEAGPDGAGEYRVALTDEGGNVLAVQTFGRMEDAREFANDVVQWQASHQQQQSPEEERATVVPVSEKF